MSSAKVPREKVLVKKKEKMISSHSATSFLIIFFETLNIFANDVKVFYWENFEDQQLFFSPEIESFKKYSFSQLSSVKSYIAVTETIEEAFAVHSKSQLLFFINIENHDELYHVLQYVITS